MSREAEPKFEPGESRESLRAKLDYYSLEELYNLRAQYWRELELIGLPHESEAEKWQKYEDLISDLGDVEMVLMAKEQQEEQQEG